MLGSCLPDFDWDPEKDRVNRQKHGVAFATAQLAFFDPKRVLAEDVRHSSAFETRWFCFGWCDGGVLTVRFTYREGVVRIFGAGYWTKGRRIYEEANQVHARPN
jgi:uncharacterized protein